MPNMNPALKALFAKTGAYFRANAGNTLDEYVARLRKLLRGAGSPGDLQEEELLGLQVICALAFPCFWVLVLLQIPAFHFLFVGPMQVLLYIALILGGFYFPLANIRDRMRKRHATLMLELPDTLDLLAISVEAGLDFMTAMKRVVEKLKAGPLREELERFFKQIELGRPRREALRELADRAQLSDLNAVVSALVQADRLGASIGPVLIVQSDMLRKRRAQRAEKAAQEAPVKMLAPLLLCIFPAVFIMILGPVFIQMLANVQR
jgi:tight adherence protein C